MAAPTQRSRLPRAIAATMLVATCAAGLGVRTLLQGAAAKYLGVALYGTAMFWLFALLLPRRLPLAAAAALALCWAIEFAQLTTIPATLSAQHTLVRLALGSVFSPWDLPAYAAGIVLGLGTAAVLRSADAPSR